MTPEQPKKHSRGRPPATELSPAQQEFIRHYLATGEVEASAAKAGYARDYGTRLLKLPLIVKELAAAREKFRERTQFDLEAAVRQAEEDRRFAIACKNPMAAHKSTELICRLSQLLVDRIDMTQKTVDLTKVLAGLKEQRERVRSPELENEVLQTIYRWTQRREALTLPAPKGEKPDDPFTD